MSGCVAVIAQARMGSSRLPGKVLKQIAGRSVLTHVLSRAKTIPGADIVCCATTTEAADDAVAAEAERAGCIVFRGSPEDVLDRYAKAAQMLDASVIVRITCDCPLLDAEVCGDVIRLWQDRAADYAANNLVPTWPHGLDCEVFSAQALNAADAYASSPYDREHVTPWIRSNPKFGKVNLEGPGGEPASMRWALDYPEDFAFLQALNEKAGLSTLVRWRDVVALLQAHPALLAINLKRSGESRPSAAL
jgi:spore coat polysaccharide biosynthesis protein SpsF (cytidylyltransferase family)